MHRTDKSPEVIVIEDDDLPSLPPPRRPDVQSSNVLPCYICRKSTNTSLLVMCSHCTRPFHPGCLLPSAGKTQPPLCVECQNGCGKCGKQLNEKVRCPRCALSYHPACEQLLNEFQGQQICSTCIIELTNLPGMIETRYESKELMGKRLALVKFRGVSYLHLSYVQESLCQDVETTGLLPPTPTYEKTLKWRGTSTSKQGLVKFVGRPESEAVWEYEFVINGLKPDPYTFEEWMCQDIMPSSSRPRPAPTSAKTIIEKAQELILAFGYDPSDPSIATRRAYTQLKFAEQGIDFNSLVQELPNVLAQACLHFNNGSEVQYKGAVIHVKEVFFRNIEVLLIRNTVKELSAGRKTVVSTSETYKTSFQDFKSWQHTHDTVLLSAVDNFGFGCWRDVGMSMATNQDLRELYKLVFGEDAAVETSTIYAKVEQFIEQRARFLVYCLMEDEYLNCESR